MCVVFYIVCRYTFRLGYVFIQILCCYMVCPCVFIHQCGGMCVHSYCVGVVCWLGGVMSGVSGVGGLSEIAVFLLVG